jgi:hypothetical protein
VKRSLALLVLASATPLAAQDTRDEALYYPGSFNWTFLKEYPEGGRLFNAFDYGHAILYERLTTLDSADAAQALARDYRFLTEDLLVRPPRFGVSEEAVAPTYAKLMWPAMAMFDRAHILHRQLYDIYADRSMSRSEQHALAEELTDRYLAERDMAFVGVLKSMALMDGQPFSQRFKREHPDFNGLIWAYHWLQVGLYEPLLVANTEAEAREGVQRVIAGFWDMVRNPAVGYPTTMPMTAQVSPTFAKAHPRAAAIFDNLHSMHDIISDVLAHPEWSRAEKRAEIVRQLVEFRDGSGNLESAGHVH